MFQRCFSGSEALNPRSSKRTDRCQRPHRKGRPFEIRLEQQLLLGVTRNTQRQSDRSKNYFSLHGLYAGVNGARASSPLSIFLCQNFLIYCDPAGRMPAEPAESRRTLMPAKCRRSSVRLR